MMAAVVPGLDHQLGHGHGLDLADTVRPWRNLLPDAVGGGLVDGVWSRSAAASATVDAALALARTGAAVGVAYGAVEDGVHGPPLGRAMVLAATLARGVRQGEVVVPASLVASLELAPGVGQFAAPDGLFAELEPVVLLKDYR